MKTAGFASLTRGSALLGLSACIGFGVIGCRGKSNNAVTVADGISGQNTSQNVGGASAAVSGATVSDADAQQFTDKMSRAMRSNDVTGMSNLIDVDALAKASVADLNIPNLDMAGFTQGMRQSLATPTGLPAQLAQSIANGGSVDLLRFVEVDHQKRARMRLVHPNNGGVNYIDFILGRDGAGQVVAQDMYIFYSGELLSQTVRRLAVQMAAQGNQSLLERLKGTESEFVKHIGDVEGITTALAAKNGGEAARLFDALPDSLKQNKTLKLMHIQIAELQGDTQYTQAIADFRAAFPNDPASDLISIDYYLLKKQYDKSLEAVNKLDSSLGGDPYLNVIRAYLYITEDKMPQAQDAAEKAAQQMPDNKDANTVVLLTALINKRYEPVPAALNALKKAGEAIPDVATNEKYAGFRSSPQYKEWQKMQ